jgi:uncharacterized membrane protein YfcA
MKELATYAASVGIGFCLGLIGAGGSILTIPVFVYILKTDPVASTIYSMFIVGICSFVGSMLSFFKNLVDLKAAILFGIPSVAGVFIARKIIFPTLPQKLFLIGSFAVSKDVFIMISLTAIMLFVSVKMLRRKNVTALNEQEESNTILFLLQGIFTGIVTGLLGVGGGFLIVPALLLWVRLPVKTAIGTTLFIITINSAAGFITSYTSVIIEWPLLIKFAIGAIIGILVGTKLSERVMADNLKKILAWFIIMTSVYVLFKQFKELRFSKCFSSL